LIAADYTGGVALGTLLNQVPLVGIHPQPTEYGAYLWGGKADIKWIRPSCTDLVCTARISEDKFEPIIKRFLRGAKVLETVKIDMRNDGVLVAECNLTYWVQDTYALRKNALDENRIHPLYDHQQKTSARLIAGLRGLEQDKPIASRLFNDPNAAKVTETHGRILAQRSCLVAPQLQLMVASRTKHIDEAIENFHQGKSIQIINVGAGLDTRIFRLNLPKDSIAFELDLPVMLKRREALIEKHKLSTSTCRVTVPINLREQNVATALTNRPEFNQDTPTFIIWEGGSMYFEPTETMNILNSFQSLMVNPDSRLWMDYVAQSIVDGTSKIPVVNDFIEAMRCLGEPFINGFGNIGKQLAQVGFFVESDKPSSYCLNIKDSVFELYRFSITKNIKFN
jgi:methyltransferase (TIGR00027 family)